MWYILNKLWVCVCVSYLDVGVSGPLRPLRSWAEQRPFEIMMHSRFTVHHHLTLHPADVRIVVLRPTKNANTENRIVALSIFRLTQNAHRIFPAYTLYYALRHACHFNFIFFCFVFCFFCRTITNQSQSILLFVWRFRPYMRYVVRLLHSCSIVYGIYLYSVLFVAADQWQPPRTPPRTYSPWHAAWFNVVHVIPCPWVFS